jgi:hypothetical protein
MLAQIRGLPNWSVGEIIIAIIVIAACVGILYVALQQFGVAIPGFVVRIFWICVCAALAIIAIRFLLGL